MTQKLFFLQTSTKKKFIFKESTSSNCDAQFQERLTLCASDLMRLGVFSHSSVNVDQLTLNDLSRQQREYFIELCR